MFRMLLLFFFIAFHLTSDAGKLKSVIYDFEGLAYNQSALPDGFYSYGDLGFSSSKNPLGYSGMLGNTCLKFTLSGSAGYAALGRGVSRFIELETGQDIINFYFLNTNPGPVTFSCSLTEDDNKDGIFSDNSDDKFSANVTVQSNSQWQLISLPLKNFTDANTGGNGILDIGYVNNKGMFFNIELRFTTAGLSLPLSYYLDMICFSDGTLPTGTSVTSRPETNNGDYCRLGAVGTSASVNPENIPAEFENLFSPSRQIKYVNTFLSYSNSGQQPDNYPGAGIQTLLDQGYKPIITLEPFYSGLAPLDSRQPRLNDIISGAFDFYFDELANRIKSYTDTVYIRPMHEFDGDWYPWCISQNGGDPKIYANAYKHIVDRFRAKGTNKVKWMWCPNPFPAPNASYNWSVSAYPGDAYVDVVGTNIYNHPYGGTPIWRSFRYLLSEAYYYFGKYYPSKPFFIFETGCRERSTSEPADIETKAGWIAEMDVELRSNFSKVRAMIWFNTRKEHDWRVNSSEVGRLAYENVIWKNEYYFTGFSPVEKLMEDNAFSVFPNPAKTKVFIRSELHLNDVEIRIFDITGKTVFYNSRSILPIMVSVENLQAGLYFLEIRNQGKQNITKLMVSK